MRDLINSLHDFDPMLRAGRRILIATDFDGTLCPIAASPAEVRVDPAIASILRQIEASERITIAVISGRQTDEIRSKLPFVTVLAGNHGLEISAGDFAFVHPGAEALVPDLHKACSILEQAVAAWPGAWVEHKRLSATLHYRQVQPAQHRELLCTARRTLSRFLPLFALRAGKLALEIRPKVDWDKGRAVELLAARYRSDFVICLGDDRTDEAMFVANPRGLNVHVGACDWSAAPFRARNCVEIALLLSHVCAIAGVSSDRVEHAIA